EKERGGPRPRVGDGGRSSRAPLRDLAQAPRVGAAQRVRDLPDIAVRAQSVDDARAGARAVDGRRQAGDEDAADPSERAERTRARVSVRDPDGVVLADDEQVRTAVRQEGGTRPPERLAADLVPAGRRPPPDGVVAADGEGLL